MNLIITLSLIIVNFSLLAQVGFVDFGEEHVLRINSNGSLGINLEDNSPISYSDNPLNNYLAQAGLWIVAQQSNGQYHTATHYLNKVGVSDFWPGPIDTLNGQAGNQTSWNKVWHVTKEQIQYHQNNFNKSNYQTPQDINAWPAEGSGNFAKYLAPFVDSDGDKSYSSSSGDYPAIKGDECVYLVFNDVLDEHSASLGAELGIEVQMMAYRFYGQSAIFLEYYIIHRGPTTFDDVQVGFFIDGECGNPYDNYAGTFEERPQSIFTYNADDTDEGFFGSNTPYAFATFLNNNLVKSIAFNNSSDKNGKPTKYLDFVNYGLNKWKDSSDLTFGGNGTNIGSKTPYIYSQSTNNIGSYWTEHQTENNKGERVIIGKISHSVFSKGDHIRLNLVLDIGLINTHTNYRSTIKTKAEEDLNIYKKTTDIPFYQKLNDFNLYPNPSKGSFTVHSKETILNVYVTDSKGIKVYSRQFLNKNRFTCNILLLPGIYTVQLQTQSGTIYKKLCLKN